MSAFGLSFDHYVPLVLSGHQGCQPLQALAQQPDSKNGNCKTNDHETDQNEYAREIDDGHFCTSWYEQKATEPISTAADSSSKITVFDNHPGGDGMNAVSGVIPGEHECFSRRLWYPV